MNSPLFLSLPQLSLNAALLIIVLAALRWLSRGRLPAQTRRLLWWLALLRLLLPLRLPCPISVWNWLPNLTAGDKMDYITPNTIKTTDGFLLQSTQETMTEPLANLDLPVDNLAGATSPVTLSPWLLLWAVGALLCAAYFGLAYWRCRRRFQQAIQPEGQAAAFLADWLAAHPLRRPVRVLLSPDIDAPLTYGLLHPVILLPANADFSREQAMHFALLHEWTHIRHFDAAAKLLAAAALCVHWFNPLVWLFFGLFSRDLELACDAAVLQNIGCELPQRQAYASALLDWEQRRLTLADNQLSTSLYNNFGKNVMEERIVAIMNVKKVSFLSLTVAGLLLVGGVAFATNSAEPNPNNNSFDVMRTESTLIVSGIADGELDDEALHQLSVEETRRNMAKQLAPYEKFGLSWQYDDPDGDGQGLQMFYQGREVRGIWDEQTNSWFTEHAGLGFGAGAGELHTVYTDGQLSGLRWANAAEQAEWNKQRANASRPLIREYEPFGLQMNEAGQLFYQGQRVRYFWDGFDVVDDEVIGRALKFELIDPEGEIDLRCRRQVIDNADGSTNGMGPLLGLEVYQEENFSDLLQPAAQRITYDSADALIEENPEHIESVTEQNVAYTAVAGDDKQPADPGLTIAQKLAKYEQFGLEYQEINKAEGIQRSIYYQGQLLKGFVDVQPGGAVFSVQSSAKQGAADVVRTVYNEQGELSGLRLATPEELAAEWQEQS